MKKQTEVYEYSLTKNTVDECSNQAKCFLNEIKSEKRNTLRIAMSLEEILIKNLDEGRENAAVTLTTGIRFFRPFITLEIDGNPYNVYTSQSKEDSFFGQSILKSLGIFPEYSYLYDRNRYNFSVSKKRLNPFFTLILAVFFALLFGFTGLLLPEKFIEISLSLIINPVHDAFLNILSCIAGPMVFLSVAWGIYGIGDAATLKKVGKKILFNYITTVYILAALFSIIALPLFKLNFSGKIGTVNSASDIIEMILNVFPKNIFTPFTEGNTIQIIFLAIVIGIAMLFLGQKTTAVATAVEQINYIVQFLIEFINKLVPYFIFIVLLQMLWSDTADILLKTSKLFLVFFGTVFLLAVIYILYTSYCNKISPLSLIKKGLPTFLIAFTTASSAAAFGSNMKACKNELGIKDTISSFGIPLGMVTFKPTTSLNFIAVTLFFAESYNVEITASWVLILIITVATLAIATPPIPGGALAAYTVLFAQLKILPPEALAIALACDTVFDFFDTGFDQFLMPMALLNQSSKLGLVDKSILKGKKKKS